jgi:hypothetical protein
MHGKLKFSAASARALFAANALTVISRARLTNCGVPFHNYFWPRAIL